MHINLEWWSNVPMVSSVGYILDSLHILLIILRSGFLSFMDCWANSFDRALLATIRDKGICPCPRFIPKSQLDQTGMKRYSRFWLQNNCTYLFDRVLIARNAIYKSAAAITPPLIAFSRWLPLSQQWYVKFLDLFIRALCFILRMLLLINLAVISTSHICSLLIFCMSLSWVSGKHFSPI